MNETEFNRHNDNDAKPDRIKPSAVMTGNTMGTVRITMAIASIKQPSTRYINRIRASIGLMPDWWKLPSSTDPGMWRSVGNAIRTCDPHVRGILVLGLDMPVRDLGLAFASAATEPMVKGFAVGRTIFWPAAERWFAGEIQDAEAISMIADIRRLWPSTTTARKPAHRAFFELTGVQERFVSEDLRAYTKSQARSFAARLQFNIKTTGYLQINRLHAKRSSVATRIVRSGDASIGVDTDRAGMSRKRALSRNRTHFVAAFSEFLEYLFTRVLFKLQAVA